MIIPHEDKLSVTYGTDTPTWEVTNDSLSLLIRKHKGGEVLDRVMLTEEQHAKICQLTGVTDFFSFDLNVAGEMMPISILGRKTDQGVWSGLMAHHLNTLAVATQLSRGLSFAEQLVAEVNSVVLVIDKNGKLCRFNKLGEELSGLTEAQLIGKNALDIFMMGAHKDQAVSNISGFFQNNESYEVYREVRLPKGMRTMHFRNKFIKDWQDGETYLICSGVDVTDELKAKARLEQLANSDELTGLPNRHRILSEVNAAIEKQDPFTILFLDLDNFKKINDCYGHSYGDKLLAGVAERLQSVLAQIDDPTGRVGRLGGDEFLVMLSNDKVDEFIANIYTSLEAVFKFGYADIYTTCSIGAAVYPRDAQESDVLVRFADTAMYVAKDSGKQQIVWFEPYMNQKVLDYLWLDENLRLALRNREISVVYQPKIDIKTHKPCGMEALIRWKHPVKGFISPVSFIPFAEESGLIHELGRYVMEEAAVQMAELRSRGLYSGGIAVNLSPRQLGKLDVLDDYRNACLKAGIQLGELDVEITESCFMEDQNQAVQVIEALKEMGATVYMDDFGTGFSSLSQLVNLPVDVIKMDRSFIRNVSIEKDKSDVKAETLVKAMTAVAQQFGMKLVAEGVESLDQLEFLRAINVDIVQGYFYAKPMPPKDLYDWLAQHHVAE